MTLEQMKQFYKEDLKEMRKILTRRGQTQFQEVEIERFLLDKNLIDLYNWSNYDRFVEHWCYIIEEIDIKHQQKEDHILPKFLTENINKISIFVYIEAVCRHLAIMELDQKEIYNYCIAFAGTPGQIFLVDLVNHYKDNK